jgi:hypothetical protein
MVVTRSKAKLQISSISTSADSSEHIPLRPRAYPSISPKTIVKPRKPVRTSRRSSYFTLAAPEITVNPNIFRPPSLSISRFGLIQESLDYSLYFLCVQAILWNQTRGQQARPVLGQILTLYPSPEDLAAADLTTLTALLHPIGLHNIRGARLIAFARAWVIAPPSKQRRYRRLDYPSKSCGRDIKPAEVLDEADSREGWEIAHLPGIGAYALDSYRIFYRDRLRAVQEGSEEEWRRVVPLDKDLRAYLVWRWREEGWEWDMLTGKRQKVDIIEEESS